MTLERITRWLAFAMGIAFIALVLVLSIMRLVYPYEIEWMEGAMLDHVVRILSNKSIYSAPSIDFVAWLYPPLYYYAVAAAAKIFGIGFFAGRIVSFSSTILTTLALGWIVQRMTKNWLFAFLTIALYFATYHATGFYFDIVRNDAFFTLLIVGVAFAAIMMRGAVLPACASALMISLAFLTKQQAIFFLPPLTLWFWFRSRKQGIIFASCAIVLTGIVLVALHASTQGWSTYYLFKIPGVKRADFSVIRMFDVFPNFALGPFALSSLALAALILLARGKQRIFWSGKIGLLAMMALAALAAGAVSLGNEGGDRNVMMPFAAFVIPLLPIAMSEIRVRKPEFSRYMYLPILFQFAALYFNPLSEKMVIASAHQRAGGDEFMRKLRAMPGEVYIPYHGYIARQAGKASHAQLLATIDVLRVHDTTSARLQADFDSAFARHRFSAVIMEECPLIPCDSVAHYTLAGRMIAEPNVMLTRFGGEATRPEFVFVPK
jgi:4-amino-4-deoxy-L-arabinose transferase-like glycosyltransferase